MNPCGGIYVIGRPALSKGQVELADGKRFIVTAANLSDENIYVQSVTLNGRNLDRAWLTHDEIVQGGTLAFVMGPEPNRKWTAGNPDIPVFSETRL